VVVGAAVVVVVVGAVVVVVVVGAAVVVVVVVGPFGAVVVVVVVGGPIWFTTSTVLDAPAVPDLMAQVNPVAPTRMTMSCGEITTLPPAPTEGVTVATIGGNVAP
jgi:hypothetical protein